MTLLSRSETEGGPYLPRSFRQTLMIKVAAMKMKQDMPPAKERMKAPRRNHLATSISQNAINASTEQNPVRKKNVPTFIALK